MQSAGIPGVNKAAISYIQDALKPGFKKNLFVN